MSRETTQIGFTDFSGNEQTVASTIDDPAAYRLASPSGALGKFSANVLRSDGGQEEKCLIIFKQMEDGGFEFYGQRPGTVDDANMIRLFRLTTEGAWFFVPMSAPNIGVTPTPQPPNPQPPTPPSTNDPTHGIPPGAFGMVINIYGFASDDESSYFAGGLTWSDVIARMDRRDDYKHYPR